MNGRAWTEAELAFLHRAYRGLGGAEVARRLGRPLAAVYNAARVRGLAGRRVVVDAEFLARLRELNAAGLCDSDAAAELGVDRSTASRRRRRLGLPSHAYGERRRARTRAATEAQCEAAGVSSLGEYRALVFRVRAVAAGRPVDLRWRAVQILEALERHGPMTREQIARAIGVPWKGSRRSLCSNDPEGSYLANLVGRGLVISLGRVVRGEGRGGSVCLYALAMGAEAIPGPGGENRRRTSCL